MSNHYLFSPEAKRDPYEAYKRARAEGPLHFSHDLGFWVFASHEAVHDGLADLRLSRVTNKRKDTSKPMGVLTAMQEDWFLYNDPPKHTRLRNLVKRTFTARRIEQLRMTIQAVTDELLVGIEERGGMDLATEFSYHLPAVVIAEMLGAPTEDRGRFKDWSSGLALAQEPSPPPAIIEKVDAAMLDATEYLGELAARRRAEPGDDLLSALVAPDVDGDRLTEAELIATCVLLLTAGHETTTNLVSNGILALLENPAQLDLLRRRPELIGPAVEELLRFEAPTQMTGRVVAEDYEFLGKQLRAGDKVLLLIGSANRDEAAFEKPDELDISRQPNNHVAFGHGIHFCTGAALARAEGQIAISTLVNRFPDLRLGSEPPERASLSMVRNIPSLKLEV